MHPTVRDRFVRSTIVVGVVVLVFAATACDNRAEIRTEALAGSRAVTFTTTDGVQLAGRLFGPANSTVGVVFSHMLPSDQSSWYEMAWLVAGKGYRALTFDFRGYCPGEDAGCSQGSQDPAANATDLTAALTFLRAQGVRRTALVGASMGGTASIVVAAQEAQGVRAVITLSAPASIEGLAAGPDQIQAITAAKLFIAGNGDGVAAAAALAFYNQGPQPKDVKILPSNDHGTALLEGNQSEQTRDLIIGELQRFLPVA
ncbi:MAG: alpha/beta hydrolase [Actinomycetota bacterium]|nr:alpha/beta hydrolase [Actinomycetota bacterium]